MKLETNEQAKQRILGAWDRRNRAAYAQHEKKFQREQERHLARVEALKSELNAALQESRDIRDREEHEFFSQGVNHALDYRVREQRCIRVETGE